MLTENYYSKLELINMGFKRIGENVLISRLVSIHCPENISIGNNIRIDDFCYISAKGDLQLGNNIHIASFCGLYATSKIIIGDFSGISARCLIYSSSDDYSGNSLTNPTIPVNLKKLDLKPVILGKHVIVGAGSIILPGVNIGDGVAIGAMSLVKTNLSEWGIYCGIPVKFLNNTNYLNWINQ